MAMRWKRLVRRHLRLIASGRLLLLKGKRLILMGAVQLESSGNGKSLPFFSNLVWKNKVKDRSAATRLDCILAERNCQVSHWPSTQAECDPAGWAVTSSTNLGPRSGEFPEVNEWLVDEGLLGDKWLDSKNNLKKMKNKFAISWSNQVLVDWFLLWYRENVGLFLLWHSLL